MDSEMEFDYGSLYPGPHQLVPWPTTPWDEIIPNLYQGGTDRMHLGEVVDVVVADEFGAVFSFFWGNPKKYGPDPGTPHVHYQIPDGELGADELAKVKSLAKSAALGVKGGVKTLVRCQAGYNRSGLVVALALLDLGYDAHSAVELIRVKRSPNALHRLAFLRYIIEESEARGATE